MEDKEIKGKDVRFSVFDVEDISQYIIKNYLIKQRYMSPFFAKKKNAYGMNK